MKTTYFKTLGLLLLSAAILTLTGCDKSGTPSNAEGIIGIDRTAPVITLIGDANVTLNQGDTYTEAGATAVDDIDGPVPVVITGTVDTSTPGVYTLTYTATDSSSNEANVTRTVNVIYTGPAPLDGNMTIDNAALQSIIASIFDNTPYNPAISVQGVINNQGLTVSVPYTVSNTQVTLAAYSTSVTLDANVTEDDEAGIIATFSWAEQNLSVGSGTFIATITIDDSAGNDDGIYKAKRLDIEDDIAGITAATFPYATDSVGGTGTLTLKILPGIPDRMFGVADNNDDPTTHMFIYIPVTNPVTGKTWLNNNLGANYANVNSPVFNPTQQATASNDHNAYGSLFQWGRKADGHELIDWISSAAATPVNGVTNVQNDNPTDALFISSGADWRITPDDTLWVSEVSANNVCPVGYRVPTDAEVLEETSTWTSLDAGGALASNLKIPTSAWRNGWGSGEVVFNGEGGLWVNTGNGPMASFLYTAGTFQIIQAIKAHGLSVRCIKD